MKIISSSAHKSIVRQSNQLRPMAHLFLLLLLLLQLPHSCTRAQEIISTGSALKPEGPNRSWLSPSGDFAFGFRSLETNSSLYLLAIWFEQIEEKTIVWYTNGSTPMSSGSSLQFTHNGTLSLRDSAGAEVWRSPISGGAYASMNDTGNFVIYGADGSPMWQSFTTPADTILPSQELSSGTLLQAKLMDTDYSNGRFILSLETDGNLTFYTVAVPTGFNYDGYWSTNTSGNGGKLVYDVNGTIYYALENSMQHPIIVIMPAEMDSTDQFYHWAKLDPDGVLRQYKYPKKSSSKQWVAFSADSSASSASKYLLHYVFKFWQWSVWIQQLLHVQLEPDRNRMCLCTKLFLL